MVEMAEVQNRQLLASYLTRIKTAKLTNKHLAADLVSFVKMSKFFGVFIFAHFLKLTDMFR